MTREKICNSMTVQDAVRVLKETNCYGTMDIAKSVILRALEQEPCEDCCNGNQEEKAKLCQKSYIAGMEHNCENEEIIKVSKGALKARQGRFVIYDAKWLKEHFNTTEAKIYGQPSEDWNAVLDELNRIGRNAFKDDTDYDNLFDFISNLPNIKPQPSERTEERAETHACDYISRKLMMDMGATCIAARKENGDLVALGALDILPSATPQPKTGKWEWVQYDANPNIGNWHCSECSCILRGETNGGPVRLPKYCPECGAKMQEVQQ